MSDYRVQVRNSSGWRNYNAATLGVSVTSPNWQNDKFASILKFAAENFKIIRIDVTDALYRHNFMAEGLTSDSALARANALGALWLTQHQDIIDACPIKPQVVRWAEWYNHPDYQNNLSGFQRAHEMSAPLRAAVSNDVMGFFQRKVVKPTLIELEHSKNYLIEEMAILSIQAKQLPGVRLYPGEELACMKIVRQGQISEAPKGLEQEQYAKIKMAKRNKLIAGNGSLVKENEGRGSLITTRAAQFIAG